MGGIRAVWSQAYCGSCHSAAWSRSNLDRLSCQSAGTGCRGHVRWIATRRCHRRDPDSGSLHSASRPQYAVVPSDRSGGYVFGPGSLLRSVGYDRTEMAGVPQVLTTQNPWQDSTSFDKVYASILDVARSHPGLTLVDSHAAFIDAGKAKSLFRDSIHRAIRRGTPMERSLSRRPFCPPTIRRQRPPSRRQAGRDCGLATRSPTEISSIGARIFQQGTGRSPGQAPPRTAQVPFRL